MGHVTCKRVAAALGDGRCDPNHTRASAGERWEMSAWFHKPGDLSRGQEKGLGLRGRGGRAIRDSALHCSPAL